MQQGPLGGRATDSERDNGLLHNGARARLSNAPAVEIWVNGNNREAWLGLILPFSSGQPGFLSFGTPLAPYFLVIRLRVPDHELGKPNFAPTKQGTGAGRVASPRPGYLPCPHLFYRPRLTRQNVHCCSDSVCVIRIFGRGRPRTKPNVRGTTPLASAWRSPGRARPANRSRPRRSW